MLFICILKILLKKYLFLYSIYNFPCQILDSKAKAELKEILGRHPNISSIFSMWGKSIRPAPLVFCFSFTLKYLSFNFLNFRVTWLFWKCRDCEPFFHPCTLEFYVLYINLKECIYHCTTSVQSFWKLKFKQYFTLNNCITMFFMLLFMLWTTGRF